MTGTEMHDFNTQLLSGLELEDTFFFQNLNMRKGLLEAARDWMVLRTFDSSISFSTSDDHDDTKSLPARFSRLYSPTDARGRTTSAVTLVDSAGNPYELRPLPFSAAYMNRNIDGYYFLDMKNGKIGRTGHRAGTLYLHFIQNTADIEAESEWTFPEWAHPLLPFQVAITHKGGVDYDLVNASQVPFNREDARTIESRLAMWDSQLQLQELGV